MKGWMFALLILALFAYVAPSNQVTKSSSSLLFQPKIKCKKYNSEYDIGEEFKHPNNPCRVCECCETGKIKCKKSPCPLNYPQPPPCGKDFHEIIDGDECCDKCNAACMGMKSDCPVLNCAGPIYYADNDCCGQCGCERRGVLVGPGAINDSLAGPPCEQCVCNNGTVTCDNEVPCPAEKLECVDPKINDQCNWTCPDGKTCFRGDLVIRPGETIRVGEKICYCLQDPWYPLAVCANQRHQGSFEEILEQEMCMKQPDDVMHW